MALHRGPSSCALRCKLGIYRGCHRPYSYYQYYYYYFCGPTPLCHPLLQDFRSDAIPRTRTKTRKGGGDSHEITCLATSAVGNSEHIRILVRNGSLPIIYGSCKSTSVEKWFNALAPDFSANIRPRPKLQIYCRSLVRSELEYFPIDMRKCDRGTCNGRGSYR